MRRGERNKNQRHRNTKDHKRILWTTICQQIGQSKRNNKFSEIYKLPTLNQEEIDILNRLPTMKLKQESKNSQHTRVQNQIVSPVNSTKHLKKS